MRRAAFSALLAVIGVLLVAPSAEAHALVRSSSPSDGTELAQAPEVIAIAFTEQPEPSLSSITVLDQSGEPRELGDARLAEGDASTMRVEVGPLEKGVYAASWRVVSRVDGHATAGAIIFGVGVSPLEATLPEAAVTKPTPTSLLEVLARLLFLFGMSAVFGGCLVATVVLAPRPRAGAFLFACIAGALVGLGLLAEVQRRAAQTGFAELLDSSPGRALLWRGVAVAIALGALVAARFRPAFFMAAASVAAAGGVAAHVAAGHAGAGQTYIWLHVVSQWLHVCAAGIWVGGLVMLLLGTRGSPSEEKGRAVHRFSRLAGVALFMVIWTGVLRAFREVDSWGSLLTTSYGRMVLVKLGLFALLAGLGAINRFRNTPRASRSLTGLRRTGRWEVLVAVTAVAAASLLASLIPPRSSVAGQDSAPSESIVVEGSNFAKTLFVTLRISPGFVGPNSFRVELRDEKGKTVHVKRLTLRFLSLDEPAGETELELQPIATGGYEASGSNIHLEGRWRVIALIGRGTKSAEIGLEFATRCRTSEVIAPGQPTIHTSQLSEGRSAQLYADFERDEVHATFFDPSGNELSVESLSMESSVEGGDLESVQPQRLSAGHFVGYPRLVPGKWRFEFDASTEGEELHACFEEVIGE